MTKFHFQNLPAVPASWRKAYLDSLSEAQEFHLENLVKHGRSFLISHEGNVMGYAVENEGSVIEFYLDPQKGALRAEAFKEFLKHSGSTWARCKTFDIQMMEAAESLPARKQTGGILFRKFVASKVPHDPLIVATPGTLGDMDEILAMHDGFFDSREEIQSYLNEAGLMVFRNAGEVVGCGILKRIIASRNDFDIGMVVSPEHRRKGLGSYIVERIKDHCLQLGYNPVCGCHADNIASRHALEKAGFIASHSILEFRY